MIDIINIFLYLKDRETTIQVLQAIENLARETEIGGLLREKGCHTQVVSMLTFRTDEEIVTHTLHALYILISNTNCVEILEEIFDDRMIQEFEYWYNSKLIEDSMEEPNLQLKEYNSLYIMNICSNIADKYPESWETFVKTDLFYNALSDMKNSNHGELVREAGYFCSNVFSNLDNENKEKLNLVSRTDVIFEPILSVLTAKFSPGQILPTLQLLKLVLNYWVDRWKFDVIEKFKQLEGDKAVEKLMETQNGYVRSIAIEIYNEHFSYDIQDDDILDQIIDYEGNYYF